MLTRLFDSRVWLQYIEVLGSEASIFSSVHLSPPQSSHGSTMAFVSSFPCLFGRGSPSSAFFSLFHSDPPPRSSCSLPPRRSKGRVKCNLRKGAFAQLGTTRAALDFAGHLRGFLGSSRVEVTGRIWRHIPRRPSVGPASFTCSIAVVCPVGV